ncbi:MAG: phosphate ABC transporter permease PstA [Dehalococcoidia bacterium]|nr:MAG: phosphate ABC transporter permease PstA [Dehalococcoidia bacterium]
MMIRGKSYNWRKWGNRIMLGLSATAAGLAILVVAMMLGYILVKGISFINLDFITSAAVPPGQEGGGMRNELIGTLILVGLGSLIAVPIGMMAGIFLSEFGSPIVQSAVRFASDILAGVPSIVVGVFAYAIIVRPMHSYSAFSAGVALAIIMIPVIARTTEESMRLVPGSMREAALALGITRWRAVVSVVIPGALAGIVTGIMLGVARIAGETAPLMFTAFGNSFGYDGLGNPIGALPLQIYRYAISPYENWKQQAWAGAFLLVMLVLIISIVVRWLSRKRSA